MRGSGSNYLISVYGKTNDCRLIFSLKLKVELHGPKKSEVGTKMLYGLVIKLCKPSHIRALMMGTGMVPETSAVSKRLTRLIAREDFINVSRRESYTSHTGTLLKTKSYFICAQYNKLIWKVHRLRNCLSL
jgi:hypothetical protein